MSKNLTWHEAIQIVLAASSSPMRGNEIVERIIEEGLREELGATPGATVGSQIYTSIKQNGDASPYKKVGKGLFALREDVSETTTKTTPKLTPTVSESEETEDQYAIVSSFGMFWRRDAVEWKATPKLLGMQAIGATPVDFNKQLGIYLLYDGREVIYAGRSTDRPLGKRLYEHTVDRLSTRWDRFSWFGLLPVSEEGVLGELPDTFEAAKLIPALEAILIEALEPRQNRKRGDDLASVEFMQVEDMEIENRKIMEKVAALIGKK